MWAKNSILGMLDEQFAGEWGEDPASALGNAKVLRATNLDNDGRLDYGTGAERQIAAVKLSSRKLQPGDTIMECAGGSNNRPVGRVGYFSPPDCRTYLCSNFFRTLRPGPKVWPKFLFWRLFFRHQEPGIWSFQQQTTSIINLKHSEYLSQELLWPELGEQRLIADILDTADEAIRQTEAVISKLKLMKDGLLHDLLTCGLDAHGRLRDPIAHPEQFKDSPLGRIPKEWEARTIESLAVHVGSGVTPTGGSEVYKSEGVLFIRSQNVTFGGLLLEDVAFIDEKTHLTMRRSEVFPHDVLLNITGASIGRCCPLPEGLSIANVNQHVCAIRLPSPSRDMALYLNAVLASYIGQSQIDRLNAGGNREGLNYQQIRTFVLPWPEADERYRISAVLAAATKRITDEEASFHKLRLQKAGLMHDLLTGRVSVSAAEVVNRA